MSYKINDNTIRFEMNVARGCEVFLRNFEEEAEREAFKNTPKATGRLRSDVLKTVNGLQGKMIWKKRYAIYQEKKQYSHYTTPGTGPHFAENAIKNTARNTASIARRSGLIR